MISRKIIWTVECLYLIRICRIRMPEEVDADVRQLHCHPTFCQRLNGESGREYCLFRQEP